MERLIGDPMVGAVHDFEVRVRHESGEWRWLQFTATNLLQDESVRGIVLNGRLLDGAGCGTNYLKPQTVRQFDLTGKCINRLL